MIGEDSARGHRDRLKAEHADMSGKIDRRILVVNIFLFAYFLALNFFQPLAADDLCRGATAALWNHTVVEHLGSDYMHWTGRMTAQLLAYVFFNAPMEGYLIPLFNILNAFFIVLLIYMLFKIVTINHELLSKNISVYLAYAALTLIIMYETRFLKNSLWKTGGLQYLWGLSFVVIGFYKYAFRSDGCSRKTICAFSLGLFIGNYNEIYFSSIVIVALVTYIYLKFSTAVADTPFLGKPISSFLLGDMIGGGLLLAAPGNYVRLGTSVHGGIPFFTKMLLFGETLLNKHYILYLLAAFAILSILRIVYGKKDSFGAVRPMLAGMSLLVILLLQFIPIGQYDFDDRMFMFWDIVAMLLLFHSALAIDKVRNFLLQHQKVLILSSVALLAVFMTSTARAYYSVFTYNRNVLALIEESKTAGSGHVVIPKYSKAKTLFNKVSAGGLSEDRDFWPNKCAAAYYGVKSIAIEHEHALK